MLSPEFIDSKFTQIEGKIKTLKYLLNTQSSVHDFRIELENLTDSLEILKSHIEQNLSPLRNG
jgi:cell fate (sporulation/competence/biofilm development) regulator YmcA (YheA/YmcA/DUF963 family)